MIQFKALKLYSHLVPGIRFPQNKKNPFIIVYFSENSTLLNDYPNLNIIRPDVRKVIIPKTTIPFSYITPEVKTSYKTHGLQAFGSNVAIPKGQNLFYDISLFLETLETAYKSKNYRQRSGLILKNLIDKIFSSFPSNYEKVLMYGERNL